MTNFFTALMLNPLLQLGLLAALASSIVGGVVGSYVVIKRIAFISGGISHSVLGGIGLCLWLHRVYHIAWLSPIYGAFVASILSALLIGWIHLHYKQREDSVIAAIWTIGMATGVVFLSLTPGSSADLENYLLGNILWVNVKELIVLIILDVIVVAIVTLCYNRFLILCFDENQAKLQGIRVEGLYFLLLILIALSIVILIQIVGVILVITMLILPATIANIFIKNLFYMMIASVIISAIFCFLGMMCSFYLNWPTGATIALIAGACYLFCLGLRSKQTQAV